MNSIIYKKYLFLAIIFFGFLSFARVSLAADYYVDNTCANNGNGISETCASVSGGAGPFNSSANAQAGFTGNQSDNRLLFKKGQTFSGSGDPGFFIVGAYGTAGHPAIISSYGTGAKPIISGGYSAIYLEDKSYVTIDGLQAQGATGQYKGNIYLWLCNNIIIKNCTLEDTSYADAAGIGVYNSPNVTIDSNTITNPTGAYGIIVWANISSDNMTISNNVITTKGTGIETDGTNTNLIENMNIFGNDVYGCRAGIYLHYHSTSVIHDNYVHDNLGTFSGQEPYGVGCRACNNTTWYNNRIIKNHNVGISFWGGFVGGQHEYCNGNKFYNNIVADTVNTVGTGVGLGFAADGPYSENNKAYYNIITGNVHGISFDIATVQTGGEIYNNTVYGNSSTGLLYEHGDSGYAIKNNIFSDNPVNLYANAATTLTTSNNLYYKTAGGTNVAFNGSNHTALAWKTEHESTAVITNPNFVGTSIWSDFRLQAGSPAIDAGANLGTSYQLGLDPADLIWPPSTLNQNSNGSGWEIGAFAYVGAEDTTPPAAPTGVAVN